VALVIGTLASLFGVGLAQRIWVRGDPEPAALLVRLPRGLPLLSYNKFYFDELYDRALVNPTRAVARTLRRVVEPDIMDGWVSGIGSVLRGLSIDVRSVETGFIRDYASLFAVFAVLFVVITVVFVAR